MAHAYLAALAAVHLAWMAERPTGARLSRIFRAARFKRREWSQLGHVFDCIRILDLKRLPSRGGLSVYEVARAVHLYETHRAGVVSCIYQFAIQPCDVAAEIREAGTRALQAPSS